MCFSTGDQAPKWARVVTIHRILYQALALVFTDLKVCTYLPAVLDISLITQQKNVCEYSR